MDGGAGRPGVPTEFYHGTSLEAILAIQEGGFRVDLSGSNAGAALGPGVYITTTLQKALNYAKPNPAAGGVFQLQVYLDKCYQVASNDQGERTGWVAKGFDSAWASAGVIGQREENCVRDPNRVRITNVVLGNTGEAAKLGFMVRNGRLERTTNHQEQERRKLVAMLETAVADLEAERRLRQDVEAQNHRMYAEAEEMQARIRQLEQQLGQTQVRGSCVL